MTDADHPAILAALREQGYALLPGFLEPEVVDAARAEMAELVEAAVDRLVKSGRIRERHEREPLETRLMRVHETCMDVAPKSYRVELHRAGLFGVFFHARLLDVVESIVGPEVRLYPNYTARPKFPDWEGTLVLWHQDAGYTAGRTEAGSGLGVAGLRMVNAWTPLVPATPENGCMEFIPGTHRLGPVPHVAREHYLEIAPDALAPWLPRAMAVPLDPGDVVLFDNLLFHRGLPNRTRAIRWSLDWRYQDARQPTMRPEQGHMARSRLDPERVVAGPREWAALSFR